MKQSTRGLSTIKYEDKKYGQKHNPFILQARYEIFTTPELQRRCRPWTEITPCSLQAIKSTLLKLKMHTWVANTLGV